MCVTDVGETVLFVVVPAMTHLRQPGERLRVLDSLRDELADHVAVVHFYRADRHDLLSISGRQRPDEHRNQCIQLRNLHRMHIFIIRYLPAMVNLF